MAAAAAAVAAAAVAEAPRQDAADGAVAAPAPGLKGDAPLRAASPSSRTQLGDPL